MKLYILILVICLAIGCWGISIDKKEQASIHEKIPAKTMLQKMQSKMQAKTKGLNLLGYPQSILKELNIYRRKQHYFPRIRWFNSLAATATQEAQHIVSKRSFGEHVNFGNWRKKIRNRFFTELALHVDTEGMRPSKRIFAKTIVEALRQEQEWYLIHPYTHAGIAIIPGKRRNNFIVVIHLSRSPSRFHSCKEASDLGIKRSKMTIFNAGKKYKVKCDQKTAGGGWTRVLSISQTATNIVVTPIDDKGMKYTEVLFKTTGPYLMDYYKGHPNVWDFDGYNFALNALKFDNLWYISKASPTHGGQKNAMTKTYFTINSENIQILKKAGKCFFGATNRPQYCAKEFIFKKIPKGRLNAISDVESIRKVWTGDNLFKSYFQIFVR